MARSPSASYATPAAPMNAGKDNLATATGAAGIDTFTMYIESLLRDVTRASESAPYANPEGESMPVTEPIIVGCCDTVTSTSEKDGPLPG